MLITPKNKKVYFQDWGFIPYAEAWQKQKNLVEKIVQIKLANRKTRSVQEILATPNYLIFCEHPPVYTLGKNGKIAHLLITEKECQEKKIEFFPIDRGGDITFHGPGQIVGYPILDLENFFTDLHLYLRKLEQAIISLLQEYNLEAGRIAGLTGVWLGINNNPRKIAAIGIRCSRWVTMHGFALNINTDLSFFNHIIPCGISDKAVTSLAKELGYNVPLEEVKPKLIAALSQEFEWEYEVETTQTEREG
ncbi:MAG: lipoyl(octanoyl) transferase LipB [Bacteroidia bacterium]|nr:lipoyl(octanoyl) transferase LipB [Bacteroidia bacterium]MDW8159196.1 lipoyl(octanoyl) transferase LipB [Bacteroidia bacterium]